MTPTTHGVWVGTAGTFSAVKGHRLTGASTTAVTVKLPTTSPGTGPIGGSGVIIRLGTPLRGRATTRRTTNMVDFLLRRDEEGQTLAEYALILALIAILAILALLFLGGQINAILSQIGNAL